MENPKQILNKAEKNKAKVAVGLSGGVDSSVSASLLVEQGYEVHGVFLECWRGPGCRVDEDRKDALDVALELGIPFQVLDFKKEYYDKVVEYFYAEYKAGRTPNPDTMCNREIKFGMFYDWAMEKNNFDYIATGHYARVATRQTFLTGSQSENLDGQAGHYARVLDGQASSSEQQVTGNKKKNSASLDPSASLRCVQDDRDQQISHFLQRGVDPNKDQSYFLYQLRSEQLEHILFPIGHLTKTQVRAEAEKRNLKTASKPDSQGICFIGPVNVTEFLEEKIEREKGDVVIKDTRDNKQVTCLRRQANKTQSSIINNQSFLRIGTHTGYAFHTIGQKVGKEIDQELVSKLCKSGVLDFDPTNMPALFVIEKDIERNLLVVGTEEKLLRREFEVISVNWLVSELAGKTSENLINQSINQLINTFVRIRNLGDLFKAELEFEGEKIKVRLEQPIRAVAPGQACVFYSDGSAEAFVLGGGIIV